MSANSSLLPSLPNTTTITEITPEAVENERIFFQTAAARGISGIFVWLSLIITCHQVRNRSYQLRFNICFFTTQASVKDDIGIRACVILLSEACLVYLAIWLFVISGSYNCQLKVYCRVVCGNVS